MENAGKENRGLLNTTRIVFFLLCIIFPLFFFGGPGYHSARSFKEAWNLGHILFFFPATWLAIKFFLLDKRQEGSWKFFLLVFATVLVVGIGIELLQGIMGGRSVDPLDVCRNQLGSCAAFVFTGVLPVSRTMLRFLRAGVVVLLLLAVWPLYPALRDEYTARNQFPLLADFETPYELGRWQSRHRIYRQQDIVRHGRYGLRVQLSTAKYSGTGLFYFPNDWSKFNWLHFSVYNPENETLALHCRIHDDKHGQHGRVFEDRFHKRFILQPGWNDLSVSLEEVRTAPSTRLMDMTSIEGFGLFVVRQQRTHVLYLDNIYLSR